MAGNARFSSTLMGLKFMQRAQEKEKAKPEEECPAEEAAETTDDRGEIVLGTDEDGMGCVVIMDGDPPPTAAIGRISCNRKNPDIEKLAKKIEREKEKREVKRKATEESDEEEATVTEQEMAKSLSKRRKGTRSEGRQDEDKVNEKE
mmetsp:Transcript_9563/g.58247  ORF Transcript_9563/g.58247 Transcript_9563/m.58247 type:complete len:147 (-) Transcript_9563:2788-3228(-)